MSAPEENYMQAMRDTSLLFGMNDVFVEGLYEDYLADPASVPEAWHGYFDILQATPGAVYEVAHSPIQRAFAALPKADAASATHDADLECKQAHVSQLIDAYRILGMRAANLDPLDRYSKPVIAELDLAHYGLGEADMESVFDTSMTDMPRMTLREILQLLRKTYCGSIGAEYMYIGDVEQKRWIQARLEEARGLAGYSAAMRRHILERMGARVFLM